jgi:Na+-translocating ferredoxin:NAD+ oxidoreductase subunit C
MANDYPQADPTLMLYSVTHRKLKPGRLPTSQGVLLLDAVAALAVGNAAEGRAMLSTPLAIHLHLFNRQHFLEAPVGTSLASVLQHLEVSQPKVLTLRGGDLLRDLRVSPDCIVSGSETVLHATPPELPDNAEPCIRCGWCLTACPTLVQPAMVLEAAQRENAKWAVRSGIHACIECGLCSHVCPSRLPILQAIREMRKTSGNFGTADLP